MRPFLLAGASGVALLLGTVSSGADEPAQTGTKAYWGEPQAAGGTCCATLGEVRTNIDRIDRQIVALIAERGSYVREAARFKANPAAVEDKAPPDVVEATYRALIAAYTEEEKKVTAAGVKP